MPPISLEAVDELLVSREFMEDPYPILQRLRQEDPVHWSDSIGGWVLTRYDDIVTTFKDVSHYSSEGRLAKATAYLPADLRARFKAFEDYYHQKSLIHSDPPITHACEGWSPRHSRPGSWKPCGPVCGRLWMSYWIPCSRIEGWTSLSAWLFLCP
jgi:hypothetical protein